MEFSPIACRTVKFKKCDLLDNRFLIGIDSGSSMTKIVFLDKDNANQLTNDDIDYITLSNALFSNEDFERAVKWARQHAHCPDPIQESVHITGNCARSHIDIIEKHMGVKAKYIHEMLTIAAGCRIGLERIGLEQLISPAVETISIGKIENKMFDQLVKALSSKFDKVESSDDKTTPVFPCIIHVYGSASGFFYFDENGKGEFTSCLLTGGKTFIGLAKCLLDTNNYDEIMQLASKGNRANVDTQVNEILVDHINSPYGTFPPEMPLFPFGKCMDLNIGLDECKKEDVALSLIAYFAFMIVICCAPICIAKRIPKVYVIGNIFRSNLFKAEIQRIMMCFPFMIELEVLDFGYFGALGAMFCEDEDREKYCSHEIS